MKKALLAAIAVGLLVWAMHYGFVKGEESAKNYREISWACRYS